MTDKEYWEKRAIQYNQKGDKTANKVIFDIKKFYGKFIKDVEDETLAFYGKYAEKTGLSISDVKKLLNPKELQSYRDNLKRYYDRIDELKVNGKLTKEVLTQYKRELDELSAKSYMSRLEALKSQLKYHIIKLGVKEDNELSSELKKLEEDIYVRSCYDIDTFRGYTYGFAGLSETQLNRLVNERWLGDNYSSRVWKNKEKLIDNINNTLVTGIARGFNPNKIAEEMKGESESGLYVFERLCRTECSHILNEARMQSYRDTNVKRYEFIGTLDDTTCGRCGGFDGENYALSEKVEGVNFPPLHPNCRCSTAPYFPKDEIDEEADKIFGENNRISKNADGEIQYVSSDMTFKQWKNSQDNKYSENYNENRVWLLNQFNKINITGDEKTAIEDYTESDFTLINRNLRYNRYDKNSNSDINTKITNLINVVDKSKVGKNIVVWRGAESDFIDTLLGNIVSDIPKSEINKILKQIVDKGVEFEEKGMMSTSIHPGGAHGKTMMKINIPKDAKGLYIEPITKKETSSWEHPEDELLLQRGYKLKVKNVNYNKETFQYEVEADLVIK